MFLFGKKKASVTDTKGKKKRAEAFVDFEHWYISLDKQFSMRPDIRKWRDMVAENYDIKSMTFFGDFSNQALRDEITRIREVTSKIIDTQNPNTHYKKDFTDFIMLDSIYQRAMASDDIDTFILFTGDGHFNSVVSFLRTTLGKEVVIYGVKDATSTQLKNSASSFILTPSDDEIEHNLKRLIVKTINGLYEKRANARVTLWATAEAISKDHDLDKERVTNLLNSLIESGHIIQSKRYVARGKYIKVINIDKALCEKDKLL